jgi:L-cystine uptake protein TcyP (sodium:dicarboxylate symporter family)
MTPPTKQRPDDGAQPPRKQKIGLAEKVLIGLVVGVAVGIFFGEKAAFLRTAGNAFIMLLQISVIPHVMVSLITALGRLTLEDVKSLGRTSASRSQSRNKRILCTTPLFHHFGVLPQRYGLFNRHFGKAFARWQIRAS